MAQLTNGVVVFLLSLALMVGVLVGVIVSRVFSATSTWRLVLSVVPGPVVAWLNKWLALFDGATFILSPTWVHDADTNAAAFSVPAVVVAAAFGAQKPKTWLAKAIVLTVVCAAVAALLCFCLRSYLSVPNALLTIDTLLERVWQMSYVIVIVLVSLAITFAVLLVGSR
jgi:hypothetical protein